MLSGKVTSKKNGFFPAHSAVGKPILTDGVQMAVHPVRRVINVEPQHGQLIPGTAVFRFHRSRDKRVIPESNRLFRLSSRCFSDNQYLFAEWQCLA